MRPLDWGMQPAWSPGGDVLAYSDRDEHGVYQLYTIAADGTQKQCISCQQQPGAPSVDRHKGSADWDPSGKYLVVQVEMERHIAPKPLTEPGRGVSNNIWIVAADGQRWHQLTDYKWWTFEGILYARFSPDGKKMLWSERTGGSDDKNRNFGEWQLALADFVDDGGLPRLENTKRFKPGNGTFYEPHGFSPDGSYIIFTADIGRSSHYVIDIYTMNLATGVVANMTDSDSQWDEHAHFSPSGSRVAYITTEAVPGYNGTDWHGLRTEVSIMNSDASQKVPITHYNSRGFPESTDESSAAASLDWKPDGTSLAVEQILTGKSYNARGTPDKDRRIWIIDFDGACGGV